MRPRKRHLWWLLACFLALLLLAGVQGGAAIRQQAAIQRIEQLGGRIVTTHGEPTWLLRLLGDRSLGLFEQATLVNLSGTAVGDAELALLQKLRGVERLNLRDTRITDDGLRHLAGLTRLKALDLSGTRISGQGLVHLQSLTALEYLYLGHTRVGDTDLHHLQGLMRLHHLDVTGTAVSDDGVAEVNEPLTNCRAFGYSGQ